jgi:hypothetical protein
MTFEILYPLVSGKRLMADVRKISDAIHFPYIIIFFVIWFLGPLFSRNGLGFFCRYFLFSDFFLACA